MDPIVLLLKEDILPEEKSVVNKVRRQAPWFWLFEDQKLYKCSFSGPYLLCIHPKASKLLIEVLHEGFVEATQEVDLYFIEPSRKAIGGQICRRKYRNM